MKQILAGLMATLLYVLCASSQGHAQLLADAALPAVRDTADTQLTTVIPQTGSLVAGITLGNNSTFFGRTQETQYPYVALELTYATPWGLWGSVMGHDLFATTAVMDETDLSIGWDFELTSRMDASVSYTHFLFPDNSPLVASTVNNSLDGYVGYDWGYVYTRLSTAYVFGKTSDVFVVLENSRYFELGKLWGGMFDVEPRFSLTFGTQRFAETSILEQQKRNAASNGNGNGGGNGNGNGSGNGGGNGNGNNGNNSGVKLIETTTEVSQFRLLNYELRVPLTYTRGRYTWQLSWRYIVPTNLLPGDVSIARSYLTAGFYFTFK